MIKKLLITLIVCFLIGSIEAEDQSGDNNIDQKNQEIKKQYMSFEVKNSKVFEDFKTSLSVYAQTELHNFIQKAEEALSENSDFEELIIEYQNLFDLLKINKEGLPRIILCFAFDKEDWHVLVSSAELNLDILKNNFSEIQLVELNNNLIKIESSLQKIGTSILSSLECANLQKALKEKNHNQMIRIGLMVVSH